MALDCCWDTIDGIDTCWHRPYSSVMDWSLSCCCTTSMAMTLMTMNHTMSSHEVLAILDCTCCDDSGVLCVFGYVCVPCWCVCAVMRRNECQLEVMSVRKEQSANSMIYIHHRNRCESCISHAINNKVSSCQVRRHMCLFVSMACVSGNGWSGQNRNESCALIRGLRPFSRHNIVIG